MYRVARGVDLHIYAYVDYVFSDGIVISDKDWSFNDELEVQKYGRKGFLLRIEHVKLCFPSSSPAFEYLDCVTQ